MQRCARGEEWVGAAPNVYRVSEPSVQRTLVKSPPEIWAEVSDAAALARHLGELGEIRITRLEPETTVAWEGERASGTVELEPSGWGTRVTLTATALEPEAVEPVVAEEPPAPEPEPAAAEEPARAEPLAVAPQPAVEDAAEPRVRLFARLFRRRSSRLTPVPDPAPEPASEPAPEPAPEPDPAPDPVPLHVPPEEPPPAAEAKPPVDVEAVLTNVLDTLGAAHHRPFSRA